jgi:hypothetical protein
MGRKAKRSEEMRQAMRQRVEEQGLKRTAAAKEVAAIYGVSVSTAYKSYVYEGLSTSTSAMLVKRVRRSTAEEYALTVKSGKFTLVKEIYENKLGVASAALLAQRMGTTPELVEYARVWAPRFAKYEELLGIKDALEAALQTRPLQEAV